MWRIRIAAGVLSAGTICAAQTPGSRPAVTLDAYLTAVLRTNLDLAAQLTVIDAARAQVTGASARPDWTVAIALPSADLSQVGAPSATNVTLAVPIELGGKRTARMQSATAEVNITQSDRDDVIRLLRGTAANAFVDALHARNVLQTKNRSLAQLNGIVNVNEYRLRAGDIGEIEVAQSRVEREQFQTEVITAEANVDAQDVALGGLIGRPAALTAELPVPSGTLEVSTRTFEVDNLIRGAIRQRPDAMSRARAVEAASAKIALARANLRPDLSVAGSYQHTTAGVGDFAQPADTSVAAGISVNLPIFRRRYPGDLLAAQAARRQAELQLEAVRLKIESEVRQAYRRYQAGVRRLELYRGSLLQDADRVLQARLYAYQRGSATLLEVLDAQRKSEEVALAYSDALADHARTLVALEQTAGIWDVSF